MSLANSTILSYTQTRHCELSLMCETAKTGKHKKLGSILQPSSIRNHKYFLLMWEPINRQDQNLACGHLAWEWMWMVKAGFPAMSVHSVPCILCGLCISQVNYSLQLLILTCPLLNTISDDITIGWMFWTGWDIWLRTLKITVSKLWLNISHCLVLQNGGVLLCVE